MTRFGDEILTSEFSGDDGSADPQLLVALNLNAQMPSALTANSIIQALGTARLLVPVVAQVESVNDDGTEKDSHIAQVTFKSADGRVGLPAFTSLQALQDWDPKARPIAQWATAVAMSCVESDLDALLIDMASPHRFAVQGLALLQLANAKTN
jgi:hypothetical protein